MRAARWAVSAAFFVDGAALGGWATHIPNVKEHLGLSNHILGLTLLASGLGAVFVMPFSGVFVHRCGSRTVVLASATLLCLIMPLLLVAPTPPLFVLTLLCMGMVNGQLDVSMNSHSVEVQKGFDRPILSAVHGWFSLGGFAGGLGSALAGRLGLSPLAHMVVASCVLLGVAFYASRGLLAASTDSKSEGPRVAKPSAVLAVLGLLAIFSFVSEGTCWDWVAVYFRQSLHSSGVLASLGFAAFSVGMAGGRFVGDSLIHRFGQSAVFAMSAASAAVGILLAICLHQPFVAMFGFALVGVGIANLIPIVFATAGNLPGIPASAGLAAVTTCGYTGFLFGPPLVGIVADAMSLSVAMGLIAVLNLVILVIGPRVVVRREV